MNKVNFDALENTPMQIVSRETKEVVKATLKSFHPFKVTYNVIHICCVCLNGTISGLTYSRSELD